MDKNTGTVCSIAPTSFLIKVVAVFVTIATTSSFISKLNRQYRCENINPILSTGAKKKKLAIKNVFLIITVISRV